MNTDICWDEENNVFKLKQHHREEYKTVLEFRPTEVFRLKDYIEKQYRTNYNRRNASLVTEINNLRGGMGSKKETYDQAKSLIKQLLTYAREPNLANIEIDDC